MRKLLSLTFIVILAIALIYALVHYIGLQGFAFAWALNFLLMGCVQAFTETLKSRHTSSYYHQKSWERRGEIYEYLGINFYRKLLVWTGWEKLNKKANPVEKTTRSLTHLHYQTKQSELGHVIIFLIVLGFNVFVALKFGILGSMWLLVFNILLNLYPILLQRYNRPRLERAINLSKRRSGLG